MASGMGTSVVSSHALTTPVATSANGVCCGVLHWCSRDSTAEKSYTADLEVVIHWFGALTSPSMAAPATEQTLEPATLTFKDTPEAARQPSGDLAFSFLTAPPFPPPTNATNQPLDWTTYKLLIRNAAIRGTRGLRAFEGSEAGEKNGQERVKTAISGRPRETTKSTGTRTNPRQHAAVRKKRPTR
jgi:hypothetical protein